MSLEELRRKLNLSEAYIPVGRPNRSGRALRPAFVTIHNTDNDDPGADALRHSSFVRNTGFYTLPSGKKQWVSWHFTVDDVRTVKQLPLNEQGIHAGAGNGVSVAVEVCMHREIDQAAADERAATLAAVLLHDLGLQPAAVRTHHSWTQKDCPSLLRDRWPAFLARVQALHASIPVGTAEAALASQAELAAVAKARDAPPMQAEEDDGDIDHRALTEAVNAPD